MKTISLRWYLLIALTAFVGCATIPKVPKGIFQSSHGFTVAGDVTKEEVKKLDQILDVMEPDVVSAIQGVEVSRDHSRCQNCSAYCTPDCHLLMLDFSVNDPATVWHEAAHAHQFARGCRDQCPCNFCVAWRKVAGDVYAKDAKNLPGDYWDYPAHGLVTQYSSKTYWEDVAEMTSDAYCYKAGRASMLHRLKVFGDLDKDPRYAQKLKLLAKYGFISQKLCDEILAP